MKIQNFGLASERISNVSLIFRLPLQAVSLALKDYRKNRENGVRIDNPETSFPSAGFELLDINLVNVLDSKNKWPDYQKRYWWKITLNDGRVIEDFYWTKDKIRGFPEEDNENRYWFIVHHAPSGTTIEGFSQEVDYKKGCPDKNGNDWYCTKYTECGPIKAWMETKDRKYLARLKREEDAKKQPAQPLNRESGTYDTSPQTAGSSSGSSQLIHRPPTNYPDRSYIYSSPVTPLAVAPNSALMKFAELLKDLRENRESFKEIKFGKKVSLSNPRVNPPIHRCRLQSSGSN